MAMTNKMNDVQEAIKGALESITTDGSAYNFDINYVSYGLPDVSEVVGGRTEIFITSLNEEGRVYPGATVIKKLTYTIVGMLQTDIAHISDTDMGIDSMKLAADIEKAILTDVTLGTIVYYSQLESIDITYYNKGATAVVSLEFYSEYQVTLGTP